MRQKLTRNLMLGLLFALAPLIAFPQTGGYGTPSQTDQSRGDARPKAPASTSQAQPPAAQPSVSMADRNFIQKAAQGGMAEVELGKLAQQQASNADVKDFAKKMVDDHGKANEQLRAIATRLNVSWPNDLSAAVRVEKNKLAKLNGAAFDKEYTNQMLKDHRSSQTAFQHEVDTTKNADIKDFASNTLMAVKDHLRLAEATASKIGIAVTKTIAQAN